jgi:altronate dehydratase large subunit
MILSKSTLKSFTFKGFQREDGSVGIRNHIVLIPASVCACPLASKMALHSRIKVVPLNHKEGCCQIGKDYERTKLTLTGLACNPNVAGVVLIALGCEGAPFMEILKAIEDSGRPVELVHIQNEGGSKKALQAGLHAIEKVKRETIRRTKIVNATVKDLVVGLECGGSDWTSGISSNPVIGWVSDQLINAGAKAILSETTEIIGAEHILANKIQDPEVKNKLIEIVERLENRAKKAGVDIRGSQPTPGNIEGGITTIEEKSLGMIHKAGKSIIQEVIEFAQKPTKSGLIFMDTPGQDVESMTGMASGGVQIMIFSTGRGSPVGFPISPVIKITGNPETFNIMEDDIDINAGGIIEGKETIDGIGLQVLQMIGRICNGEKPKAELNDYSEIGISKSEITL